jgi:hypothetical protein
MRSMVHERPANRAEGAEIHDLFSGLVATSDVEEGSASLTEFPQ